MCNTSQHVLLSEATNAQVIWCKGCKTYTVIYNSCCMSYTRNELMQFNDVLSELPEAAYCYNFLGHAQVLLKNPSVPMGICLTPQDVDNLKCTIHDAFVFDEVVQVLYS